MTRRQGAEADKERKGEDVQKRRRDMELQVTWGRVMRVWWSLVWRNVLMTLAAMVAGFFAGALIGLVLGLMGVPTEIIQIICFPIGFVIGLVSSVVPVWLIIGKDYGEFRLVLMGKQVGPVQFPVFNPQTIQQVNLKDKPVCD